MGYYLAPGACSALVAGRLLGRPSCYQMTGGPVAIIGGGFASVDSIEGAIGHPSKLVERIALAVVKQFELVVVRGNKAKEFLAARDIRRSVAVITGSVNGLQSPPLDRGIDLVFVGRLVPIKQVDQFIKIVFAVSRILPSVRAIIVGDGPLMVNLQAQAEELGVAANIEFLGQRKDVAAILASSKVFVLTSISEGLCIAMAEAMVAGVVPVVADVGELSDLVFDGVNGYLIEPNKVDKYAEKILLLLQNHTLRRECSQRAIEAAKEHCDVEVISEKWRQHLQEVVARASGHVVQEVRH